MWVAVAFESGLLVVALLLGWVVGAPPFAQFHLGGRDLVWGILATLPALATLSWSVRSAWPPLRRLVAEVDRTIVPLFARCSTVQLAVIAAAAGIAEEAFFRGVVQTALVERMAPGLALGLASALFGAFHLVTPLYALLAGLVGAYLGALLFASDNLLVPVVMHGLYDFVALVYIGRRRAPPSEGDVATGVGPSGEDVAGG